MLNATRLSSDDLQAIGHLLPGPEPELSPCPDGPRRTRTYAVAETNFRGNERRYLNECIDTNWVSSRGAFVERFERAFPPHAGCKFGVACSSGTTALHLAVAALGVGPGDEVIVPAFTMIAVANAVRYTGATVKLVDVESNHCNLSVDLLEAAITPRTRAIIVVHTYGHPADMARLCALAQKHGLYLIEDAAEAHGAELAGRRAGSFGLAGTFSFYANKIIAAGEGGMVTTNDPAFARLLRRLRDHAFSPERHFWHEYPGFNYRMTNLQAAIGLAQTERFDEIVSARRQLREFYQRRLQSIAGLRLPGEAQDARSVFWMYGIRLEAAFGCSRDELRRRLASRGVETRTFFVPINLQPVYFEQFRGQRYPVSEALCVAGLYLPTHEALIEQDADWICRQIAEIQNEVTQSVA